MTSVIWVMRFTNATFGNRSSPRLLNVTIRYHLSQFPTSPVVGELTSNMYVDNWTSGCDDHVQAYDMTTGARVILSDAGMCPTQWGSNSTPVVICEFHDQVCWGWVTEGPGYAVALIWRLFLVQWCGGSRRPVWQKSVVLSCIACLFDPLGFVTPFALEAKILIQDLWKTGLGSSMILVSGSPLWLIVWQIQSLTAPSKGHHAAGKDNSAGLLTRGLLAFELVQSGQWLHGPLFLSGDDLWDESEVCLYEGSSESEKKCGEREAEESDYWSSTSCGFVSLSQCLTSSIGVL